LANKKMFKFDGYSIPTDLVMLTGGGTNDWKTISDFHVDMYRKYTPINPDDFILEIGCGVGRDAISLSKILSPKGKYVGTDIIKPSIDWCKQNITKRHKNFVFYYHDINSQIHNSGGKIKTTDVTLPAKDNSVDRIFLHSVFTHMFKKDIVHYLKEFRRVLKPDGLVLASFFVLDDKAIKKLATTKDGLKHRHPLSFKHQINKGCYINDLDFPEGAVGFTPKAIKNMLRKSGLIIHGGFVHRGVWSGIKEGATGQDVIILSKASSPEVLAQYVQPLGFTAR
jgi:SAM-dependent methyltransferase